MRISLPILLFLLLNISLCSRTLIIATDNNNSLAFQYEEYSLISILDEDLLHNIDVDKIVLLDEQAQDPYLVKDDLPSVEDINMHPIGLEDLLDHILTYKYNKNDILLILSSMDYHNRATNTNSRGKIYNDAWLTSDRSPIKRLLDKYPGKPLSGIKIMIFDPSHDLKYLKYRKRFFSYLFSEKGGKLIYYGSLDKDEERITDYVMSKKDLAKLIKASSLRKENILMLDGEAIQYELP